MKVDIEIERSIAVPLPIERVRRLFDDLETTIGRFPKLKKLTRLGRDQYRWDMQTVGSRFAKIAYDVTYGAHYRASADGNTLSWTPIADLGNSSIEGFLALRPGRGDITTIAFKAKGELRDVPVPLMYRLAAQPFINGKFSQMIDTFLERTRDALLAEPAAPARKKTKR